jgi:pSer/pThr/pTyr-binding forkhead associated (FHA) protein
MHFSELERLVAVDATSDELLASYLKPAHLPALPFAPVLTADDTKVVLPANRSILGLSPKSLNERANRKRLAAYQRRIRGGWKGLKLLAEGDSWFNYPILLRDIIEDLSRDFAIYSMAATGDTLENLVRSVGHFETLVKEHKFQGLLLSAGGSDIVGDLLRSFFRAQPPPLREAAGYFSDRFDAFLASTQRRLQGLFNRLTASFPDLKIFFHGYDWFLPRAGGHWLAPALIAQEIPADVQGAILKLVIDRYYQMLGNLADNYRDKVFLVDCRGAVGGCREWFDELHPFDAGFARAAGRFRSLINQAFRISHPAIASGACITWSSLKGAKGKSGTANFPAGSVVTIGRNTDSTIVLEDQRVSRNHARLEIRAADVILTDLNSTNGSFIDGRRRLEATPWRTGEKLKIGDHLLELAFVRCEPMTFVNPLLETPFPTASPLGEDGPPTAHHMDQPPRRLPVAAGVPTALRSIEIVLDSSNIADLSLPAYALGVFEHVNPMAVRGPALAIDEKIGGTLSALVQGGRFESRLGEVTLVPIPPRRSLKGHIAFVGLGAINAFGPAVLEIAGERLASALSRQKILQFATVPMGVGTGLSIKDFIVRFLTGLLRGLSNSQEGANFQKVSISEVDRDRSEAIRRELKSLATDGFFTQLGYKAMISDTEDRSRGNNPALPVPAQASPVYLQVLRPSETTFEYCILSAELGAAIQSHQQTIDRNELDRVTSMAAGLREFDANVGGSLARAYVPPAMQQLIGRSIEKPTAHLVIIHDRASSTIPWEVFYFQNRCPALDAGVSRLYRLANRQTAACRPALVRDATLRMLVVENPTGDLAGAQNEGDQLGRLFTANRGQVVTLKSADASRANVLTELGSGTYDILHYAGHADFVEAQPEASGLILRDGRLSAADLLEIGNVPQMIFLNACESGRIRGANPQADDPAVKTPHLLDHVSLAEGFLVNGIANFIGTFWPVNDVAAFQFASVFYAGLLSGQPLSSAMREGRRAAKSVSPRDWANYLHFGDPLYTLRQA